MDSPKIRFKGYTDAWEQRKLGDVAKFSKGNGYSKSDLVENGTPIVLYGRLYTNYETTIKKVDTFVVEKENSVFSKGGEVIIPASGETAKDIARASAVENSGILLGGDLNIIEPEECVNSSFLALSISNGDAQKELSKKAQGKSVVHVRNDEIKRLAISFPNRVEQDKIEGYFTNLDNLITLHQRKCEQTKKLKKFMLQKMFPKDGANVPEIRFSGFTDAWEQRKLGEMCSLITKQTGFDYSATIKPSLVKSKDENTYSFIQNKDFGGMNINLDTDFYIPVDVAKKYPKITLDQPSLLISISGKIGNVGLYSLNKKAFIGGAVGICKLNNLEDGKTALYELLSPTGQKYFESLVKASSHANITVEDIRNIVVHIPKNEEEKKKINNYFERLDNLITLHQRKYEELQKIKKFMLQNLFV